MAIRLIRQNGDEILRKRAREVEKFDNKLKELGYSLTDFDFVKRK